VRTDWTIQEIAKLKKKWEKHEKGLATLTKRNADGAAVG